MNETPDGAHWLRGRPRLMAMVVRFNTSIADTIHPDRTAAWMQEPTVQSALKTGRGRRRISSTLAQEFLLSPTGCYDFQPYWRRFALLEFPSLEQLTLLTGVATLSKQLSRIVSREERLAARDRLGSELFEFAVRESRLMAKDIARDDLAVDLTVDAARKVGWGQLARCLMEEPTELLNRLQLKLPCAVELNALSQSTTGDKATIASVMRKLLIAKVEPEMAPCFQ